MEHGCELAVRIDGKPYFVDGTSSIPMAMLIMMALYCYQKASVIGEIKNNRFVVSQFKLLRRRK
jgi:hypothetical protein